MKAETFYNYCNRCGSDTHHSCGGECRNSSEDTFNGYVISFSEVSMMLECKICKQTCIRVTTWHSEYGQDRISFYPPRSKHKQPLWIDSLAEEYGDIVRQIYPVLDSGSYSLALIGIRALLDLYISRHSGVSNDFKKMLDQLVKLGTLSSKQKVTLYDIFDAGSAATHRGWVPCESDVITALQFVENIIHLNILGVEMEKVKSRTPQRGV